MSDIKERLDKVRALIQNRSSWKAKDSAMR